MGAPRSSLQFEAKLEVEIVGVNLLIRGGRIRQATLG